APPRNRRVAIGPTLPRRHRSCRSSCPWWRSVPSFPTSVFEHVGWKGARRMPTQPAQSPGKKPGGTNTETPKLRFGSPLGILLLLLLAYLLFGGFFENVGVARVPYSDFLAGVESGRFRRVVIGEGWVKGYPAQQVGEPGQPVP